MNRWQTLPPIFFVKRADVDIRATQQFSSSDRCEQVDDFFKETKAACGLYYKHCYNRILMTLQIVNAVAYIINMITIVTDNSTIINDTSRVINYAYRHHNLEHHPRDIIHICL
jgi:hypothetical protein